MRSLLYEIFKFEIFSPKKCFFYRIRVSLKENEARNSKWLQKKYKKESIVK